MVALLTMLLVGAILLILLNNYYAGSERDYLKAGAARASRELSSVDWATVAEDTSSASTAFAEQRTKAVALATQLRIRVIASDGSTLADSGSPTEIDPSTIVPEATGGSPDGGAGQGVSPQGSPGDQGGPGGGLPSPLGPGLFGGDGANLSRSSQAIEQPLVVAGQQVATLRLSEGPAYGAAILRDTFVAWLVAGLAAVLIAAGLGWWWSRRLTRPLIEVTAASDSMASGDLAARVEVNRADEIGRLGKSFNTMAGRVQHTVSALQQFVADAAHELGTPLTALEADLELAHDRSESEDEQRLIKRAMRQAERLEKLSAGLLQLSRLDSGEFATRPERLDLASLVLQMADTVASRAEQAAIDLRIEVPAGRVWVSGYRDKLETAISNLVDNALKFTPAGGCVTIGLAADDLHARLQVTDTGIGIPAQDMKQLFGRFHRARNASVYPGNGLGLAIVRATMEVHGGLVSAESNSAGSRFELTLPRL
jgi:two-component system sensor histidine kinase BaeS